MPRVPALTVPPTAPGLRVDAEGFGVIAVAAPRAEHVDLCVRKGDTEQRRRLRHVDGGLHWDTVAGMTPGTVYGLRVHGPWEPENGHWFNENKLLLDPYARAVSHASPLLSAMFPHQVNAMLDEVGDLAHPDQRTVPARSETDSADVAVWSVVVEDTFDWQGDQLPRTDTVLYELHVKGYTALHPEVPEPQRGTYRGLTNAVVLNHLQHVGVTAVELLPIHASMDEKHLTRMGLPNYWGYSTLSYFAPNPAYATAAARDAGPQGVLDEVKEMVRGLHSAGIEVILDVVYNHTAESGYAGPSLSFRGLDNHEYYWMNEGSFVDVTGTGGTVDPRSVHTLDMILASLRYWVESVHVDGFRFDLAATLGRDDRGFRSDHPLLRAISTDPVLRGVKLIAEPWDIGGGGWQTGNFPSPFAEWNDAFRNDVRSFWLADRAARLRTGDGRIGGVRDLATRLAGSRDIIGSRDPRDLPHGRSLRAPWASINYVTAHDGMTLQDLVTYDHKHNRANGEDGRDGTDDNRSWNHGYEGPLPPDQPHRAEILEHRERSARSLLATLLLAAGTPMLCAGDEFGRTQQGNNNAYCQDNEISWVDWSLARSGRGRIDAVHTLLAIRRAFGQLTRTGFPQPVDLENPRAGQVAWFSADGRPMRHEDWLEGRHVLQMLLYGDGRTNADLLLVFSSSVREVEVTLPVSPWSIGRSRVLFDSTAVGPEPGAQVPAGATGDLPAARLMVPAGGVLVLAPERPDQGPAPGTAAGTNGGPSTAR
jgi:glycogen operon protein